MSILDNLHINLLSLKLHNLIQNFKIGKIKLFNFEINTEGKLESDAKISISVIPIKPAEYINIKIRKE